MGKYATGFAVFILYFLIAISGLFIALPQHLTSNAGWNEIEKYSNPRIALLENAGLIVFAILVSAFLALITVQLLAV